MRGRPCSPCDGLRRPLQTSADALIPILMSLHVMFATSPTTSGAARRCSGGADTVRQRCLMARAGVRAPSDANVQALPDSSSHVVRRIRCRQRNTEFRRTRVIVYVCRRGRRRSGLSRILTSVCHTAVVSSRQNVRVSQHHVLVDRTILEEGRARSLSVDPADQFRGPCQYCRHVGTIRGRAPQFHAVGHAQCYAGPEDELFRCRTPVSAAQVRQPLMQCRPAVGRSSCLLSGPASVRLKAQP